MEGLISSWEVHYAIIQPLKRPALNSFVKWFLLGKVR